MMIKLYEDNAGGLHMTDEVNCVSELEHAAPGSMIEDLKTFEEWFADASGYRPEPYEVLPSDRLIATWDGEVLNIYGDRMGVAGKRYAVA